MQVQDQAHAAALCTVGIVLQPIPHCPNTLVVVAAAALAGGAVVSAAVVAAVVAVAAAAAAAPPPAVQTVVDGQGVVAAAAPDAAVVQRAAAHRNLKWESGLPMFQVVAVPLRDMRQLEHDRLPPAQLPPALPFCAHVLATKLHSPCHFPPAVAATSAVAAAHILHPLLLILPLPLPAPPCAAH